MADKYILRVTAGPDYDAKSHVVVPVNSPETVKVSSDLMDVELNVRVQNYKGLPRNSPTTSPYFSQPPHDYNKDQYSIAFRFTPKEPPKAAASGSGDNAATQDHAESPKGITATDLQFGNDFDHPIRNRLPPGFNTAMNIVKWWIDPGLEGDVYADEPYLYGPGLSSFNTLHVGAGENDAAKGGLCFDEGGDEAGLEARRQAGAPDAAKARMKWALKKENKDRFVFAYGQTYGVDFFNPYLDFGDFSLKLPGFTLPIMKYWDGQGLRAAPKRSHCLRYVLRNRSTGAPYLVVLFTLYLAEDVNEDGSLKPRALEGANPVEKGGDAAGHEHEHQDDDHDEAGMLEQAQKKFGEMGVEKHKEEVGEDDGGVD